ncbi:MAG: thioredoxin-disulfide reductase [Candidatus Cloacimonadaceae bacterium]|nr:thioredoxin-disulfide reductase [Candidatus Cloacimonadaceae bacterium]
MLDFNVSVSSQADADEIYDLIIIGGGPAGLTAGLYAARYKLRTLLLEKAAVSGGQLIATQWVENYPGFPEPVLGQKLASDMESQARLFGLEVVSETVLSVELEGEIKEVRTTHSTWKARSILICTGSSPRRLDVPGEAEYSGKGVSYCATCDGPFYPDKEVAVVGGGNSAFEESLFIAKYASKITLIHRKDTFNADGILQEKVKAEPKIKLITDSVLEKIDFADEAKRKIHIRNLKTKKKKIMSVDGVFIFVGNIPNTALFEGKLKLKDGFIVTDRDHYTSVEGVWAAGDVQSKALRQVATAVGDGAAAAFFIHKYLMKQEK